MGSFISLRGTSPPAMGITRPTDQFDKTPPHLHLCRNSYSIWALSVTVALHSSAPILIFKDIWMIVISGNGTDYWWNRSVDRIYLPRFSICFGSKTRKDPISKRKIGLNVRTVGFKNIYIIKYSQNGKKPGKHSVEFSILLPTSCLQNVYFLS